MEDFVIISIKGREYNIPYPNVGQYCRIESTKQLLSSGNYSSMMLTGSASTNHALDMIDIESSISILCPDLIKDLKVSKFSQLGISDYKEIRDEYIKKVAPFFKEINNLLAQ